VTAATLHATKRGMVTAVLHCAGWPVAGTLDEYLAAAQRAEDEINRAITCWQRWVRRYDPPPDIRELGSGRTNVRYEVARSLFEERQETIRLLIEPAMGSA